METLKDSGSEGKSCKNFARFLKDLHHREKFLQDLHYYADKILLQIEKFLWL